MKYLACLLVIAACGSRSQQQLETTPTATTHRVHEEAPAASTSDLDREGVRQTFQQMENTQNAYRESKNAETEGGGSGAGSAVSPPPPPAPPPPPKKTGPAEQAPKQ